MKWDARDWHAMGWDFMDLVRMDHNINGWRPQGLALNATGFMQLRIQTSFETDSSGLITNHVDAS